MFSKKVLKISSSIVFSSIFCNFGDAFSQGGSLFYFQGSLKEAVKEFCKKFSFNDVSYPEYIEKELLVSENFFEKNKRLLFSISNNLSVLNKVFFELVNACHEKEHQLLLKLQEDANKGKKFIFASNLKSGEKELVVSSAAEYLSNVNSYLKVAGNDVQSMCINSSSEIAKDLCKEYIEYINSLCEKPVLGCKHDDISKMAKNKFYKFKEYFENDELYKVFELIREDIKQLLDEKSKTFFKNNSSNLENFAAEISEKYYRALLMNLKIFEFSTRFILKLIDDTENVFLKFVDDSTANSFFLLRTQVIEPLIKIAEFFKDFIEKEKHSKEEKRCLFLCRNVCKALYDIVYIYNKHSKKGIPCICQDSKIYNNFFCIKNCENMFFCEEARVCNGFISKTKTVYNFAWQLKYNIENKIFDTGECDCQGLARAVKGLELYMQRFNFSGEEKIFCGCI